MKFALPDVLDFGGRSQNVRTKSRILTRTCSSRNSRTWSILHLFFAKRPFTMSNAAVVVATQSEQLKLSNLFAVQDMAEI